MIPTWSGQEAEIAAFAVEDRQADDVGRQHVAGELDARELQSHQTCERVRQRGLADAGQILDQQVAACQQAGQRQANLNVLAENHVIGRGNDLGELG